MTFFLAAPLRSSRAHLQVLVAALVLLALPLALEAAEPPPSWQQTLTQGRVLVLGDSITQEGRYVSYLEYYLKRLSPGATADLISIGLSSETMSGLTEAGHPFPRPCVLERLDRALKAVAPKVVFACYGMNDGIYHPSSPERMMAFERGLKDLIAQVRGAGARLVLVTPPVFDALPIQSRTVPLTSPVFTYNAPFVDYDTVLAEFATLERSLKAPDIEVIDLHASMLQSLTARRTTDATFTYAPDGVHPGDAGHLLIAQTILRGLGYSDTMNEAEGELNRIAADPLFALIKERRELRSESWLPFVGYQKGGSFKSDFVKAAERVAVRLQREIDALAAAGPR